ncbi:hypothetical protein CPC08DRAFT_357169 [Agrocybe pediades]|nr:hypothetical protein CPC08DRAFT_357169 [Agrocybe pediades]
MVADASPSTSLAIVISAHAVAFLSTVFRLVYRFRANRLWWDDLWAFVALLTDTMVWVVYVVIVVVRPGNSPVLNGVPLQPHSLSLQLFFRFGTLIPFTTTLWAARASVAVTIVRLLNPGLFRTIAKMATYIFGAFWLALVVQKLFMCGTDWRKVPQCSVPPATGYIELSTDIAGDLWLVVSPGYMLFKTGMNRRRRYRRLILAVFCCGLFTTAACITHVYFILMGSRTWLGVTGHLQLGVSIVVCNLLVLATRIYHVFWNEADDHWSEDSSEELSSRQPRDDNVKSGTVPPPTTEHSIALTSLTEPITFTDVEMSSREASNATSSFTYTTD